MPRLERPYANSRKPNSILSEDWRDLSCNQREAYLEYDKRRILERASRKRTDCERAIEESQESWRSVGNRTWIATSYVAPRPNGVPEHFRVWARYDSDASTMKGTRSGGPSRGSILHRVTRHADSREEIMSEPIPAGTESEDPGVMARKLVRQQDIITELWYEPETTEPAAESSSASGLRTGGRDRLEIGKEETRDPDNGPGKPHDDDERQENDDAAPASTEKELGDEGRDDYDEGELMDERDAMAGPAVGIVRNPFRYGEDGYSPPVTERRGKFIKFACDPQSRLSQVVVARGVEIIRVDKTTYDILDPESMRELDAIVNREELDAIVNQGDCDMWGALPCFPWSTWQYVNMAKHGEAYRNKLGGEREISRRMVDEYIRKAEKIIDRGGRVAFEWPRFCTGWRSTRMWEYAIARDMWIVDFDGCMVGMRNRHGQPIKKMWRVITNDEVLAMTLSQFVCYHPPGIHARIEGQTSRDSALYSEQLAEIIATAWYGDDPTVENTAGDASAASERSEEESGSDISARNVAGEQGGLATSRNSRGREHDRDLTEGDDERRGNEIPGEDDR